MTDNASQRPSTPLAADGLVASRNEFHAALRAALAEAAARGCRELWLCDDDFADWPLGERAVVESLAQWAGSHRRMTLVARSFDEFARRHPRWIEWRRTWSHIVHCRTNNELESGRMPCMLLAADLLVVSLAERTLRRGRVSHAASDLVHAHEAVDAVLQRSEEAFPATTTGL